MASESADILVSYVASYYGQAVGLTDHMGLLGQFPEEVKAQTEFIFVDDGCTDNPFDEAHVAKLRKVARKHSIPHIRFFRLSRDVGFNSGGAKNVGLVEGRGTVFFLTDLDCAVRPSNASRWFARAISIAADPDTTPWTRFKSASGKTHNNLHLVHRRVPETWGYYDEDYAGLYGFEDHDLIWRWNEVGKVGYVTMEFIMQSVPKSVWSVTGLAADRDERVKIAQPNKVLIKSKKKGRSPAYNHASCLRVPYVEVDPQ